MREYVPELERLLDQVRDLLGDGDDAKLAEANAVVNQALQLRPDDVEGWLLKCQIASAMGDDLAALAAVEMALATARPPEALYWRARPRRCTGAARCSAISAAIARRSARSKQRSACSATSRTGCSKSCSMRK